MVTALPRWGLCFSYAHHARIADLSHGAVSIRATGATAKGREKAISRLFCNFVPGEESMTRRFVLVDFRYTNHAYPAL
jgi:hypothetical protein